MIPKERIPRSFRGGLYQLLRAPEAAYTAEFLLGGRAENEGLADAPATFDSVSFGLDQQFAARSAGEA